MVLLEAYFMRKIMLRMEYPLSQQNILRMEVFLLLKAESPKFQKTIINV